MKRRDLFGIILLPFINLKDDYQSYKYHSVAKNHVEKVIGYYNDHGEKGDIDKLTICIKDKSEQIFTKIEIKNPPIFIMWIGTNLLDNNDRRIILHDTKLLLKRWIEQKHIKVRLFEVKEEM
jgi:hypothetical protein